ncbi:patatin-like phospholipase family protein [Candidatus Margulisiibacteriota bacterium]
MFWLQKIKKRFRWVFRRPKRVGVAFGGGGSRGAANVGVLKVLVENKVPIHFIAGTSAGALVGALFAGGLNIYDLIEVAKSIDWRKVAGFKFDDVFPLSEAGLEDLVIKHVGNKRVEDLRIPFAAVAADYKSGRKVVLNKGKLEHVVHASSAIPGVFNPVDLDGKLLMDGLVVDNVPADVVKDMGADYVIAIDVVPNVKLSGGPKNIRQHVERAIDIASRNHCKEIYRDADIVIHPVKENISPLDFSKAEQLVKFGEQAALKVIGKIKKDLKIS